MTQFFLGAFPDMKEVYRKNDEATLADFVDPDRMVIVNRRALMSYDVLIQPDILKIFRLLDPACPLRQQVNLSKNEADAAAREAREEIRRLVREDCAVIYLTETLAKAMPDVLNRYKDELRPAIILIPGREGSLGIGKDNIQRAIERAVGADIL